MRKLESYLDVSIWTDFAGFDETLPVIVVFQDVQIKVRFHFVLQPSSHSNLVYCL